MWMRHRTTHSGYKYNIFSNRFIVQMTGGGITIRDRKTQEILKRHTGHNYLYTGDINPEETECFALENGKHFYVYSLKTFELIQRVTLPRCYEAIDVFGHYSEDGKFIYIPAHRWVAIRGCYEGYYEEVVCKYETENHTLVDKKIVDDWYAYRWKLGELWEPPEPQKTDPDVEAIMRIAFGDAYKDG